METKITIGPYSAYAIAVKYGYTGTEEEWIRSVEADRVRAEGAVELADIRANRAEEALQELLRHYDEWLLDDHPVGSLYLSADPTSPAELFGGTWEKIAENRALMGASDSHPAGSTAEAGLPNVTGTLYNNWFGNGPSASSGSSIYPSNLDKAYGVMWGKSGNETYYVPGRLVLNAANGNGIYGSSDTVQPPAYYVNIWLRVS